MGTKPEIVVVGGAVLDVQAAGVALGGRETHPAAHVQMSFGGDALNQAVVLRRLGRDVNLVTRIGQDEAGRNMMAHCQKEGVDTTLVQRQSGLDTAINVVLVDDAGERSFIVAEKGSLRALLPGDVEPEAWQGARVFSFASMFTFPRFAPDDYEALFARAKAAGLVLCTDTTCCKWGECFEDYAPAFAHIDYHFPNYGEAKQLTGRQQPQEVADAFLRAGVKNVALKLGANGCYVKSADGEQTFVPAYKAAHCVDTTGAGDNFAAGMIHGILAGWSLAECARFACATASLCVESLGAHTGVQSLAQVEERYKKYKSESEEVT